MDMLAHVQKLAGEIGPRGTGTPGELAAADYVAACLSGMGLTPERHEFRAVTSQNAFAVAIDLLALVAVILYFLGSKLSSWLAAVLSLAAPILLWQTICTSDNIFRPLLPQVTSRNVIGRLAPSQEARHRVVILAHLDTNRCRLAWQSSMVRWLEPLTWLTLGMLTLLGVLYLLGALLGSPRWVGWISLIPAGYVVGTLITLWKDERTPFTPGAHDNAASVSVALEVGLRLTASPLEQTETWLAFTGAEETDHAGLYTLLRRYPEAMRQAIFIGLEGVGSGQIVYLVRQGLCAHYRPDVRLLYLAEKVATSHPQLQVQPGTLIMEDEVGTLRRKGYCAITIAGQDAHSRSLPYWHRPDDTPDKVSLQTLERAAEFIIALLREIDKEKSLCTPS